MSKKKIVKARTLKETLRLELYALRLEQDYELLTLSQAIKANDKAQITKSLARLEKIHIEIENLVKILDDYKR